MLFVPIWYQKRTVRDTVNPKTGINSVFLSRDQRKHHVSVPRQQNLKQLARYHLIIRMSNK